jgi:predicted flap endonuclease-1-like 5' DNA nuclease
MLSKLTEIEGIGPAFAEKLASAGVTTCEKLLVAGSSAKGRQDLAAASGIDHSRLLRFVNHADLMRIKGVGGEYAELLEACGVDSVPELARRNSDNLVAHMKQVNLQKKLVRLIPSTTSVSGWITQAKNLPRAVSH